MTITSTQALAKALGILEKIEARFGPSYDEDSEINGGDAVDFICELLEGEIRPLMQLLAPPSQNNVAVGTETDAEDLVDQIGPDRHPSYVTYVDHCVVYWDAKP